MQRSTFIISAGSALAFIGLDHQPAVAGTYPSGPNVGVGNVYTVSPSEAGLSGDILNLPKDFAIHFDPSIRRVYWTFNQIIFGPGSVIRLDPFSDRAAYGGQGRDTLGQAELGNAGERGGRAGNGAAGASGIDFTLKILGSIGTSGSLWIKTDGQAGGNGGDGGQGQKGGGSSCGQFLNSGTDGGRGGTGG